MSWLDLVIAVVLAEAVAEILSTAVLFERLRCALEGDTDNPRLIGILARCGYCQSVWTGVGFSYLLSVKGQFPELGGFEPLVWGFVIHRASNLWHEAISRRMKRIWPSVWASFGGKKDA